MIERLLTYLNNIPADKVRHALGGAVLAVVILPLLILFGLDPIKACIYTEIIVAWVAVGKEGYDYTHPPHECSFYDALATALGVLLPIIPVFINQL